METKKTIEKALMLSCKNIMDTSGSCPLDLYDNDPWDVASSGEKDCESECSKYSTEKICHCWKQYFLNIAKEEK